MSDNNTEKSTKPQIIITFEAPESALFAVTADDVIPMQMLVAASMLQLMSEQEIKNRWVQDATAQAQDRMKVEQLRSRLAGRR